MADLNQDGISTPGDSITAGRSPVDFQSGLSFSRRVKISIVLLLMLCSYILMEDRPHLGTPVTEAVGTPLADDLPMQEFLDNLDFVQMGDAQERSPRESQADTLALPDPIHFAEPYQAVSSLTPPLPSGFQRNNSLSDPARNAFTADGSHSMHQQPASPEPVPPVVRFTGHIEALR